jgi:hypothetical protein
MSQRRDMGARAFYVPHIAEDKDAMDGAPGIAIVGAVVLGIGIYEKLHSK